MDLSTYFMASSLVQRAQLRIEFGLEKKRFVFLPSILFVWWKKHVESDLLNLCIVYARPAAWNKW